jgi:hypothetical protein
VRWVATAHDLPTLCGRYRARGRGGETQRANQLAGPASLDHWPRTPRATRSRLKSSAQGQLKPTLLLSNRARYGDHGTAIRGCRRSRRCDRAPRAAAGGPVGNCPRRRPVVSAAALRPTRTSAPRVSRATRPARAACGCPGRVGARHHDRAAWGADDPRPPPFVLPVGTPRCQRDTPHEECQSDATLP